MKRMLSVATIIFSITVAFFAGCAKKESPKEIEKNDNMLICQSDRKPAVEFCAGEKDCVFICEDKSVIRESIPKKISDKGEDCMKMYAWAMTEITEKTRKYISLFERKDGLSCTDIIMLELEDQGIQKIVGISPMNEKFPPTSERRPIPYKLPKEESEKD